MPPRAIRARTWYRPSIRRPTIESGGAAVTRAVYGRAPAAPGGPPRRGRGSAGPGLRSAEAARPHPCAPLPARIRGRAGQALHGVRRVPDRHEPPAVGRDEARHGVGAEEEADGGAPRVEALVRLAPFGSLLEEADPVALAEVEVVQRGVLHRGGERDDERVDGEVERPDRGGDGLRVRPHGALERERVAGAPAGRLRQDE